MAIFMLKATICNKHKRRIRCFKINSNAYLENTNIAKRIKNTFDFE